MIFNQLVKMHGATQGLQIAVGTGTISQPQAESLLQAYLGAFINTAAEEAESEISRLTLPVSQIKSLSKSISSLDSLKFQDPRVAQMRQAADALNGWTVSLLETNYTVIGILAGLSKCQTSASTLFAGLNSILDARLNSESFFTAGKKSLV